jgi:hypothetical protein
MSCARGLFRLRQVALFAQQRVRLEHHMRVKAGHIMLAAKETLLT